MPVTEDGAMYEDGELQRRGGRALAWRWWGEPGGTPVLRLQGTPGSRLYRHPDPSIIRGLGVRYLMADRPGYGGSNPLPGRGVAHIAHDLAVLLIPHPLPHGPVMGTSGGGPPPPALAASAPRPSHAAS